MSISALLSSQYQPSTAANALQQQFQQLSQALQSGNLAAAQSDFAALQAAFSQSGPTSGTTSSSPSANASNPITQAFNQVASDIQSGNLSAAQKDYSTLQQDLRGHGVGSGHHFHHHLPSGESGGPTSGSGTSSSQNSLFQDPSQTIPSLTANSLAGAQQAYANLRQQLQQSDFSGGALSSYQSSALLNQPSLSFAA